jgi:PepSY-associated transmembrane protein
MRVRKLLDWRKLLIYSHRWLGIVLGIVFVAWCVSGVVLMYYGVPHLTAGERLMRLRPLDLSSIRVTPAEAAKELKDPPRRLRISMHGDRPVYRFNTGRVFGRWTLVYADTGQAVSPLDRDGAVTWLQGYLPEQQTLRYDAYLDRPDTYTRLPAMQTHFPLHRVALDDAAGTEYYVSERSGEAVMKSDRRTRLLGLFGYITHTFFFFRQQSWWSALLQWVSWIGLAMCVTGAVVGVWRYGLSARFRHKGVRSHSPYVGWMKWHHYAGLLFGVLTITWVFSGLVSLDVIPGIRETRYSPEQVAEGARSVQGEGAVIDLASLSMDNLRAATATVSRSFVPKELELLQFGGETYLIAYRAPTVDDVGAWESRSGMDFITPTPEGEHVLVSPRQPDRAFARFDDDTMMRVARAAMPGAAIRDAVWLNEYDDYYYKTVSSFDLGLPRMAKPLPVLRVRYDDPAETWLYLTASPGQILKVERLDRANRWGYYGLHGLDFAFLYRNRPLWDVVAVALLVGVTVSTVTSLVPACRRLARHTRKLAHRPTHVEAGLQTRLHHQTRGAEGSAID